MSGKNRARIQMIFSAAMFGTIPLFVRNIPLASGEVALYRAVIATILIGFFLLLDRERVPFAAIRKELPLLLISGVAMGFNWILLFQAYRYTTVSVATLSYYFAPVIVTVACPVLFREKVTGRQVLCFVMSTVGVALIVAAGESGSAENHLLGILLGLGAAVLYAGVVLTNKYIRNVAGIFSVLRCRCGTFTLRGAHGRDAFDGAGCGGLDQPSDPRIIPYRCDIFPVFFLSERIARTGGSGSQLY